MVATYTVTAWCNNCKTQRIELTLPKGAAVRSEPCPHCECVGYLVASDWLRSSDAIDATVNAA